MWRIAHQAGARCRSNRSNAHDANVENEAGRRHANAIARITANKKPGALSDARLSSKPARDTQTQRGNSECPIRYASTDRAHWRPSRIAHTTSDWPRRMSPAANTLSTDV